MVAIRTKTSVPVTTDKKIRVRRFISDFNLDVISDVQFQMFVFPFVVLPLPFGSVSRIPVLRSSGSASAY